MAPASDEVSAGQVDTKTSHHVYVQSPESAWIPARLLQVREEEAVVQIQKYRNEQAIGNGRIVKYEERTVKLADYPNRVLPPQNLTEDGTLLQVQDMVDIPFLHEAAILYNLKDRHLKSKPYTRTGDIIVAVNPYKWIHSLYTEDCRTRYSQNLVWERAQWANHAQLTPHVYEVSALAYKGLALEQQNQSILVSGESGAGKTETVKICLHHIASVQRGFQTIQTDAATETSPIVQRVLDSNPLLEAFGNAKTIRNDNSSRFGKYIQLQFDGEDPASAELQGKKIPDCVLAGSQCEVYLLEKSRVVCHNEGERTYHIFYQLLAAPEKTKRSIWKGLAGRTNESFQYVGWTDTNSIEGLTDGQRFAQTVQALEVIGIKGEKFTTLFRSICAVLQLGNLVFAPHPKNSERSFVSSTTEFALLADLLGIEDSRGFEKSFTERKIEARGEILKTTMKYDKAKDACDAFAKEIYARSFLWLVRQINDATCAENNYSGNVSSGFGVIGLLDIFGFESFKTNGFEQLCINYANEMLQQKFTQDIFTAVLAEYKYEGIQLDEITYDDNTAVLDLIEGRSGLLAMLNEECFRPNGNDATFVRKAVLTNKASPCLICEKVYGNHEFGIKHYAGQVMYDAEGCVTKNTDQIPFDLKEMAKKSTNEIIAKHLGNDQMANDERKQSVSPSRLIKSRTSSTLSQSSGRKNKGSNTIVGVTVLTKFKTQLNSLMGKLAETQTRYIRCIKPNTVKSPLLMEHLPTVEQLRCAGVVAAVTISRSSFPNRLDCQNVLNRFRSLWPKGTEHCDEVDAVERTRADTDILLTSALESIEARKGNKTVKAFVIGKTRVYFRAGALEHLETQRLNGMSYWATEIQKIARGSIQRNTYHKQRQVAIKFQAIVRCFLDVQRYAEVQRKVIRVQSFWRRIAAQKLAVSLRTFAFATKIQVQWKVHRDSAVFQQLRSAAIVVQSIARGSIQRVRYRKALQEKKEAATVAGKLAMLKRKMEEEEKIRRQELEKERELARKKAEEERIRKLEDERAKMEQELRELRLEKELRQLVAQQQFAAPSSPRPAVEQRDPCPRSPQSVASAEEHVRVVEVVKYVEKEQGRGPVMTAEQQKLMEESGKIIEFLRAENVKLKTKNDQQRRDFATLKENNQRLMEANASAGSSFQSLNQHAKQLNGTNQKLLRTVAQYRNRITQLHADAKNSKKYLRDLADAYETEMEARGFYARALLEIVDVVNAHECDAKIQEFVMKKAVKCATMSRKVAGKAAPSKPEEETAANDDVEDLDKTEL